MIKVNSRQEDIALPPFQIDATPEEVIASAIKGWDERGPYRNTMLIRGLPKPLRPLITKSLSDEQLLELMRFAKNYDYTNITTVTNHRNRWLVLVMSHVALIRIIGEKIQKCWSELYEKNPRKLKNADLRVKVLKQHRKKCVEDALEYEYFLASQMVRVAQYAAKTYDEKGLFFFGLESRIGKRYENRLTSIRKGCRKALADVVGKDDPFLTVGSLLMLAYIVAESYTKYNEEYMNKSVSLSKNSLYNKWNESALKKLYVYSKLDEYKRECERLLQWIYSSRYREVKKRYDVFKTSIYEMFDESVFGNDFIELSKSYSSNYMEYYMAVIAMDIKRGNSLDSMVKEEINFLMNSKTAYMRLVKDLKCVANVIKEDDPLDVADEIHDMLDKYKTMKSVITKAVEESKFSLDSPLVDRYVSKYYNQRYNNTVILNILFGTD